MYDIFKTDFFDDVDRMFAFGLPTNVKFNTGRTKDMMPACWKIWEEEIPTEDGKLNKEKRGYKAICRTVGINENDIKVTEEDYGICLQGETVVDGTKYSQYIELPISEDIMTNVKSIKYSSKDGLTFIYLEVDTPKKNKINIEKI